MNIVMLAGNLGRDAEVKYTKNGKPFAILNIATKEYKKGASGKSESETVWHRATLWGSENVYDYLVKGATVIVHGALEYSTRERDDGTKEYQTFIKAYRVELMGGKGGGGAKKPATQDHDAGNGGYDDDNIPF